MLDRKVRLGDLLVKNGMITKEQLDSAIDQQKKTGLKLGQTLVSAGFITEDVLLNFLSKQLEIPVFDLKNFQNNPEVSRLLSEAYARRHRAIVLEKDHNGLLVGMADPLDLKAVDEIKRILNQPIKLALVKEDDLNKTLDLVYRRTDDISNFAEELDEELSEGEYELAELVTQGQIDAPVIKLLQSLFEDAVQVNASDIHIEPDEKILRIRLRIDGVLQEQIVKEKSVAAAIALRLKLMAGLNIAEKRLPQDGRFNIKVRDKVIDVRLSTLPTYYGESVVMRLLDQSKGILDLGQIGMPEEMLKEFRTLLKQPYGLILVTGPTGSGKSTTLYGALNELNSPEKKMITVEDPVEYRLPRITQVQINSKLDLTFARVLRTTLRQDPDIVMVGEMRDQETASVAVRASLTGHLVLSTLHTNDSASSAFRLVDMNVEGFLVAATLRGVLAQRLVRRICDSCKEAYEPSAIEKDWLMALNESDGKYFHGKGCAYCNHTGYKGRIGVFELLELNSAMINALRNNDPVTFYDEAAKALKGKFLVNNALELVHEGVTTISEAIRVSGEV